MLLGEVFGLQLLERFEDIFKGGVLDHSENFFLIQLKVWSWLTSKCDSACFFLIGVLIRGLVCFFLSRTLIVLSG